MIDEKKLIEELEEQCPDYKSNSIGCIVKGAINDCIKIIKRQPKVGEWIPCSERLPKEAGFYVVTKRQRSGEVQVALGSYRPMFNEWSGNGNFKDVIAWMPLPAPYNAERGGKND